MPVTNLRISVIVPVYNEQHPPVFLVAWNPSRNGPRALLGGVDLYLIQCIGGEKTEQAMRYPWPQHVVIGRRRTVDLVLAALGTLVFLALVVGLFFWL
jgi:hypothetical protein